MQSFVLTCIKQTTIFPQLIPISSPETMFELNFRKKANDLKKPMILEFSLATVARSKYF